MKVVKITLPNQQINLDTPGEYGIFLDQKGGSCHVSILNNHLSKSVAEYRLLIHHQAPQTQAQTIMKSVVGKGGSVKLVGKIIIDQEADGCSSFLTQRILLLDPSAKGEAVPELEILNHDVQCSHAASISSIPEEQLHYLMTRGLSRKKATKIIAEGFLWGGNYGLE